MTARRSTTELGREAEDMAVQHLEQQGFQVLMRNLRLGHFELDIVARKAELVVVVEVRRRGIGAWTSPLGSVSVLKRKRVRLAGDRLWRRYFKTDPTAERMRFDVIAVEENGTDFLVEHVPAAF